MKKKSWNKEDLERAIETSKSIRQVLSKLNLRLAGGNYTQIRKYIQVYEIDTQHITGKAWNKGMRGIGKPRIELEDILVQKSYYQSYKLKKRLFDNGMKLPLCEECGWCKVSEDGRLPLELDHINGDKQDNRLMNLRVLCPNCHSLKPTHRGCNRKKKL